MQEKKSKYYYMIAPTIDFIIRLDKRETFTGNWSDANYKLIYTKKDMYIDIANRFMKKGNLPVPWIHSEQGTIKRIFKHYLFNKK